MRPTIKTILILGSMFPVPCSLFPVPSASAAVPLKWTVETSRLQPAVFDAVRGETLALEASFNSYGTPLEMGGKTCSVFWQTNGMGSAWWTAPATVRTAAALSGRSTNAVTNVVAATFTPAMDPGATVLNGFLGSTGDIYRAAFILRFRHGPGSVPNAIEPPVRVLDLEHTVVVNPPWPTQADFAATTTVMRAELKSYVDEQIEGAGTVSPHIVTNIVDEKLGGALMLEEGRFPNPWSYKLYGDVDGHDPVYFGLLGNRFSDTNSVPGLYSTSGRNMAFGSRPTYKPMLTNVTSRSGNVMTMKWFGNFSLDADSIVGMDKVVADWALVPNDPPQSMPDNGLVLTNGSVATKSGTEITASDVGAASSAEVSGMQSSISTLNNGYTRLYNFAIGATNANFTATNYPPTAAAAASKVHWSPESGMDFSTVPASLQLNECRDGVWRNVMDTRDWTVWYYRFKEIQLTNEIARLSAANSVMSNELENAKAWANRTANGVENPMTDTLVVDRPNMWLMADYEWQKCVSGSNQCWVIRAKNVVLSGGSNTNGFLEICDAFGKPYMRVNKSAETFAEPVFTDISFDEGDGAWYIVYGNSTKPNKGGANAIVQGVGSGKCFLYDEDDPDCPATITWPIRADSYAGHWIMKAVPKPVGGVVPDMMMFGAEIKVAGRDYVEYIKEASFSAGIRVGTNVYEAVESGNTLIWTKRND